MLRQSLEKIRDTYRCEQVVVSKLIKPLGIQPLSTLKESSDLNSLDYVTAPHASDEVIALEDDLCRTVNWKGFAYHNFLADIGSDFEDSPEELKKIYENESAHTRSLVWFLTETVHPTSFGPEGVMQITEADVENFSRHRKRKIEDVSDAMNMHLGEMFTPDVDDLFDGKLEYIGDKRRLLLLELSRDIKEYGGKWGGKEEYDKFIAQLGDDIFPYRDFPHQNVYHRVEECVYKWKSNASSDDIKNQKSTVREDMSAGMEMPGVLGSPGELELGYALSVMSYSGFPEFQAHIIGLGYKDYEFRRNLKWFKLVTKLEEQVRALVACVMMLLDSQSVAKVSDVSVSKAIPNNKISQYDKWYLGFATFAEKEKLKKKPIPEGRISPYDEWYLHKAPQRAIYTVILKRMHRVEETSLSASRLLLKVCSGIENLLGKNSRYAIDGGCMAENQLKFMCYQRHQRIEEFIGNFSLAQMKSDSCIGSQIDQYHDRLESIIKTALVNWEEIEERLEGIKKLNENPNPISKLQSFAPLEARYDHRLQYHFADENIMMVGCDKALYGRRAPFRARIAKSYQPAKQPRLDRASDSEASDYSDSD